MMKRFIIILSLSLLISQTYPEFGSSETLDIITWNIENFPKHNYTVDYVIEVVEQINVDIIALQEISGSSDFMSIIPNLDGWNGMYASWPGLAYLYNTNTVEVGSIYDIYDTENYWYVFPRSPYVMEVTYQDTEFFIINNHLKCCGGSENEERRRQASLLLEEYIETNLSDKNVILLGDLNDDITEGEDDNVFWNFIEDPALYYFTDMNIALGPSSNWSYPTWPSHLDHILISDDLFDEFENPNSKIETLKLDNYLNGWNEYDTFLSDHRPVMISLSLTTLGDLNSDDIIDILDIILIVDIIINEGFNSIVDMNGDDIVNVLDLITVIDIIID